MNAGSTRSELQANFGTAVDDDAIMTECVEMCRIFNLKGEDLFYKWEAFSFNSGSNRRLRLLDLEGARALKAHIQRDLANKTEQARRKTLGGTTIGGNMFNRSGLGRPSKPMGAMQGVAKIVKTEPTESQATAALTSIPEVDIKAPDASMSSRYRYMFQKLSTRSEALDARIEEFGEIVRESYGIEELGDPAATTDDSVVIVGRIVCDADAKLNEASLLIESSRMSGGGVRVPLRFDPQFTIRGGSPDISLFPGMIVALKGQNGGAGAFVISEVLPLPLLPSTPSSFQGRRNPFSVVVASGPFTPDNDAELHFKPLITFLSELPHQPDRPSVVILTGPFIDASHPSIREGDLSLTPIAMFRKYISTPLTAFYKTCPSTLILLIPSVRDIISSHFVFPQGPLDIERLSLPPTVRVLPNPCNFVINGVRFGVSTVDLLIQVRKEEFIKRVEGQSAEARDAMLELCRTILSQRSFYPIFPSPKEFSSITNLDLSHPELLEFLDPTSGTAKSPDVLIIPSVLKQFRKVVGETTFINPSTMMKGCTAFIKAVPSTEADGKHLIEVEIKKVTGT
ncbi:DNA polymerase alpha, subunit B [Sistotremastrum suecicum HHB10207 ss-3]|uniref:DNA polymerase alpha subunit B n=1 Tax=Sistotremastrum suecicum HHB10207 ss-3 TaxID=1314776 RepID=A0A166FI23_9AGAM|nr:DNA polymerase alpha, subunit B [Sistotremastrum suecicum HHB10207 ss-3]